MPGQFINTGNTPGGKLSLVNINNSGNASFITVGGGIVIPGQWFLYAQYQPAGGNGWITFPNHANGQASLNPNQVGQSGPGYLTQIYINAQDSIGTDYSAELVQLAGNNGTLTLTQNGDFVTYGFTNQAFQFGPYGGGGNELYADNDYESSVLGSITILTPASGLFNTSDPIAISYTII